MKYRPEIDGMRAVAVGSVVLYHAGFSLLSGGFVGVDIFFVISGFLITSLIVERLDIGNFSIIDFYERRIRRIFPALFVVTAVSSAASILLLTPSGLRHFAISLAAVALSISNFWFWRTTDYFGLGAPWTPLLHTWSLGVEEQFYLVFPIYLVLAKRLMRLSWTAIVIPPLIGSFLLGVVMVRVAPGAAFFLPFGRAWELLVGSIIAVHGRPISQNVLVNGLFASIGLVLIGIAVFSFQEEVTLFPGENALLPCVGAGLIIQSTFAERRTALSSLLCCSPMLWIGRISYSLYLWHWPLLVFARLISGHDLDLSQGAAVVVLATALSYLSWRYIETPFRQGSSSKFKVFAGASALVGVCLAFGAATILSGGFPSRFSPDAQLLAAGAEDINPKRQSCDSMNVAFIEAGRYCVLGAAKNPSVALVGDSFADALSPGVEYAARAAGVGVAVFSGAGCRPLIHHAVATTRCEDFAIRIARQISKTESIKRVVLIGRWSTMVEGKRFGAIIEEDPDRDHAEESYRRFVEGLSGMMSALHNKEIYLIAFIPEQDVVVPQTALIRHIFGLAPPEGVGREVFERRQARTHAALAEDQLPPFRLVDATPYFCNDTNCPVVEGGKPLYFDDNHPTATEAVRISSLFATTLSATTSVADK